MINRFERKFVFKQTSAKNIEILIKLSKVGFYEIFYERYINNIYFPFLKNSKILYVLIGTETDLNLFRSAMVSFL